MKSTRILALLAAASFFPMTMPAQITLTGMTIYTATTSGAQTGSSYWNTLGADLPYNVYMFTGTVASPVFLNGGNTDASLNPNLTLTPGTYVIQFAGLNAADNNLGLNLYFNNNPATRITAVVPLDGSSNFSVVPAGVATFGLGGTQPGSGTISFEVGDLVVTLTDYHASLSDAGLVNGYAAIPGGGVDTIGAFTLTVQDSLLFRTTALLVGETQGRDQVTNKPEFDSPRLAGWNLVNLAMGRSVTDTNVPNQVLAMSIVCGLSSASLVVYDLSTSNVLATIAQSSSIESVVQQDHQLIAPNRARFVAQFQVNPNGNPTNGLLGGYLTIAGRVRLDPATGCPKPIHVTLDQDPLDGFVGNKEVLARVDPDPHRPSVRTGLAHLIGVVNAVDGGKTNAILVPYGALSIRRALPLTTAGD